MLTDCVLLGALTVLTWMDIKKREFSLFFLGVCAAAGVILWRVAKEPPLPSVLGGICVGGALLLCAALGRENIGLGDGLLFIVTGIYLGFWGNMTLLFWAVVLCAAAGLILVLGRGATRKQHLPFAPFVLASDVLMLIFMTGG